MADVSMLSTGYQPEFLCERAGPRSWGKDSTAALPSALSKRTGRLQLAAVAWGQVPGKLVEQALTETVRSGADGERQQLLQPAHQPNSPPVQQPNSPTAPPAFARAPRLINPLRPRSTRATPRVATVGRRSSFAPAHAPLSSRQPAPLLC